MFKVWRMVDIFVYWKVPKFVSFWFMPRGPVWGTPSSAGGRKSIVRIRSSWALMSHQFFVRFDLSTSWVPSLRGRATSIRPSIGQPSEAAYQRQRPLRPLWSECMLLFCFIRCPRPFVAIFFESRFAIRCSFLLSRRPVPLNVPGQIDVITDQVSYKWALAEKASKGYNDRYSWCIG